MLLADQTFLTVFEYERPDAVVKLPDSWDNHLAHSLWKYKKILTQQRPEIGYIHFNGGHQSKNAWFRDEYGNSTFWVGNRHKYVHDTYGLVDYYIPMPWTWARYFSASMIPKDEIGYNLTLEFVVNDNVTVLDDSYFGMDEWDQNNTSNAYASAINATLKRKRLSARTNSSVVSVVRKYKMVEGPGEAESTISQKQS